jgi:hypothetical protein
MKRANKRGYKSTVDQRQAQVDQWQAVIVQARQKWVGKRVSLAAGLGLVDYGYVHSISPDGDVLVIFEPDSSQSVALLSLMIATQLLSLVER